MKLIYDKIMKGLPFDFMPGKLPPNDSAILEFRDEHIEKLFKNSNDTEMMKLGPTVNKPSPGTYDMFTIKGTTTGVRLTALLKGNEFGGGSGSGGGASKTDKQEALQCYYLSLLVNSNRKSFFCDNCGIADLVSDNNLKYCHTPKFPNKAAVKGLLTDDKLLDWLSHGKKGDDLNVFMKIANQIYDWMTANGFKGKYHIHHKSEFMNGIYEAKTKVHEFDKAGDKKAPSSFSNDKWNPGDIWVTNMPTEKPLLDIVREKKIQNFEKLKDVVYDLALKGKLLGISLKKVSNNASVKAFNIPKHRVHNKEKGLRISNFSFGLGPKGTKDDFFSSNDVYLNFSNGEKMQLRSFDGTKSWQGETKGSLAAKGKIGGGGLSYYTELFLGKSIGHTNVTKYTESRFQTVDMERFYKLYQRFVVHNGNVAKIQKEEVVSKKTFNDRAKEATEKSRGFTFSKYMGLLFLDTISTDKNFVTKNFEDFSTEMLRYSMSNVEEASFYIKVSNH